MNGSRPGDPAAASRDFDPTRTITIVSGLPRSGTSMMMQMLAAAGLSIASDGRRAPDDDNPKGYFELEAAKRLRADASFLSEAAGKVVKVVAPLLPSLPARFDYRVVFMERDLDEVLASQRRMLERRGQHEASVDDSALKRAYTRELRQVKSWLAEQPNVSVVFISHRLAFEAPIQVAATVARFLFPAPAGSGEPNAGASQGLRVESMARVVDDSLWRKRSGFIRALKEEAG